MEIGKNQTDRLMLLEQRMSGSTGNGSNSHFIGDSRHEGSNDSGTVSDAAETLREKRRKRKFTSDEDDKIKEGVNKLGGDWAKIIEEYNLDRTPVQIKNRYGRISKKGEEIIGSNKIRKVLDDPLIILQEQCEKEKIRLEEEKEKLRGRELELERREEQLRRQEAELQKKQAASEISRNEKKEQVTQLLIKLLRDLATKEKDQARLHRMQESQRLGRIIFERHSNTVSEIWQDGTALISLKKKEEELKQAKENLEKTKKEISKKAKLKSLAENTPEIVSELEELYQQEEVCKQKSLNLKKEETNFEVEREKLQLEKNLHIRELKRMNDEEISRFNNFPVLQKRYVLLNLLGKGGFSEVFRAFDLEQMQYVACKIHQLNSAWNDRKKENYVKHACREYKIHKSVVHPRIVRLFDVFEIDENSFCTVLEYCSGHDLDFTLKQQQTIGEREAKLIIAQILSGLKYLNEQKQPVIHYDLKPGNILFSDDGVKITDFGLSKIMDENQEDLELTSQGAGTYWYLPPECFEVGKDPPKINSKVDVWSVGVIFYQMLYGKKPFGNNLSQQKILAENVIANSVLEFPSKPVVSQEAKDFIRRCLQHSQSARPDVKACVNDPYIRYYTKAKKILPPPKFLDERKEKERDKDKDKEKEQDKDSL